MRIRGRSQRGTQASSYAVQTHLIIGYRSMHGFLPFEDFRYIHVEFYLELELN